jgi:glycosyltransferase involved in cell wall biosynthesis
MAAPSHETLWLELRRRGLIGASLPEPLGGGNRDRSDPSRSVFKVEFPDSSPGKITLGNHLGEIASRAAAFAQAFPSLRKPPLFFHEQFAGIDVLGEHFFEGLSLRESMLRRSLPSGIIHSAFVRAISELQSTGTPSNEASRASEWSSWCEQICSLRIWKATDLSFLQTRLLPALASPLFVGPAETRWVHGDFTDENLLLNAKGESHLIDTEFARQTHFFPAEAAHFYALSPSTHLQPAFFEGAFARPSPAWFIYFWLTQIAREVAVNTPEYVAQWTPARLAVIRQLGDAQFGHELSCPWSSTVEEPIATRETIQIFWTGSENTHWTENASQRLTYLPETTQTVFFPVAGHLSPWRIDPSASPTGTRIHRLTAYSEDHIEIASVAGTQMTRAEISALGDTTLRLDPAGALIHAPGGDPQIVFQLSDDTPEPAVAWLEILVSTVPSSDPKAALNPPAYHIEEGRWLDLAPTFFRVGGWYYRDQYAGAAKFHAVLLGQIIASSPTLPRPDVQDHFKGDLRALMTGFELDFPAWTAGQTVELMVEFANGAESVFHSISVPRPPKRPLLTEDYPTWAQTYDPDPATSAVILTPAITFSILLPVYNPKPAFLEACLLSVQKQHFPQWELCIVDDASDESINTVIRNSFGTDPRIKVMRRTTNGGIARATNDALSAATGRYIVLLDHDDILRPHALAEFASRLGREPDLDAIYSDEDKIDAAGIRRVPFLKPDHSPEFALGVMFVGHALCVRTAIAQSLGGFDSTYDGIQDYEFFLRLMERTSRIGHIPRMLYHWRMSPSSSAMTGNVKGNMDALQVRAVQAHLARTHRDAVAVSLGGHRVRLQPGQAHEANDCTLLVAAGIQTSALGPFPVVAVNPLDHSGLLDAAQQVTTRFVAILTKNLKPENPDWLVQLSALADAEDVGAVGPVLLDAESIIASAGVLLTDTGDLTPLMRGFASDGEGYHGSLLCTREVVAMASECVVIRRETLLSVADAASSFPSDEWAVDLCLTLRSLGKRNLVSANARLQSTAPASNDAATHNADARSRLFSKWRSAFESRDPYYPAAFDRRSGDYLLRTDRVSESLSDTLNVFIDVPTRFDLRGGYLRMRGWCYSTQLTFQQVRIVLEETAIFGRYGTYRPDVPKIFPQAPGADTGFELWAIIPRGKHSVSLEFQDSRQKWHRAATLEMTAHPSWPLWFPGALAEDLVHFQLGARPSHAPRRITCETFPAKTARSNPPVRFSIVTPSYNQCRYLAETMKSVLSQKQIDLEYVVQDGGSTDGSVELIRSHASQLKHWESAKDQGQADAIARGFKPTSGRPDDVMAWLNSDDSYLPNALAYVAGYFAAHPDVDVVYGHRILIDENSHEIGRWLLPPHDDDLLKLNDYVPQEALFWRRRIWDKVGGIDASFKFAMDWDLLLRFQAAGAKIVRVPYFLACFRIHAAQKTSAQMESVGQKEIDALRLRTLGRVPAPAEVETNPRLIRYLRKSAWIEFLWRRFRIRHP